MAAYKTGVLIVCAIFSGNLHYHGKTALKNKSEGPMVSRRINRRPRLNPLKILLSLLAIPALIGAFFLLPRPKESKPPVKLYWLIPSGVRAEPDIFKLFEWAQKGELPNFKKMMEQGSYGYSAPIFPFHTSVSFAALLSGASPKRNGIADGPMHIDGRPLNLVSTGGFRSSARRIPAIWSILENANKKVVVLSTPGSTPPEIERGIVIRGRWGSWGADIHAVNYESRSEGKKGFNLGSRAKLLDFSTPLVKFIDPQPAKAQPASLPIKPKPLEFEINDWGESLHAVISASEKNGDYDHVVFYANKKNILADLRQGEWSPWLRMKLKQGELKFSSNLRFHIIRLLPNGDFRIRVLYDHMNRYVVHPPNEGTNLSSKLGPMVDFVDNSPAQLLYYPEDRQTFLEEMQQSFDWHARAIPEIIRSYNPAAVIHGIYNPSQMLSSRWWLGYVDPKGRDFATASEDEKKTRFQEVLGMYRQLDRMLGEAIRSSDSNTLIVFSSDHGMHVLNQSVHINNILAKNDLLKFSLNPETGEAIVDWDKSKAIFLQSDGIFLNPNGLQGNWRRGKGEEYEELREQVIALLSGVRDDNSINPFASITKWEDVESTLDLPKDRVGDLVLANIPGFGWEEELNGDLRFFSTPLAAGYQQAIQNNSTNTLWTPFLIMGPGVKKGHKLSESVRQIDQLPTILHLMGIPFPPSIEGKPIRETIQDES